MLCICLSTSLQELSPNFQPKFIITSAKAKQKRSSSSSQHPGATLEGPSPSAH